LISGLLLVPIFLPDEANSNLINCTNFLTIFGFIFSYLIQDRKSKFFKTLLPIYVVINLRYLIYVSIIFLLFMFFNYKFFDQSLDGFFYDLTLFCIEIIIWLNILMNFLSVQKNSIKFNQVK